MSKGTTHRTVRIEDGLWGKAKELADKNGENLSEVIRRALVQYLEKEPGMNEREEAAAKAIGNIARTSKAAKLGAERALAAADAVMFSDEAVERFAIVLHYETAPLSARWEHMTEEHKRTRREAARRMFAALKGAGDE